MGSLRKYAHKPRGPIPYPHAKFQLDTSKHGETHSRTYIYTYIHTHRLHYFSSIDIIHILEHLQLHNGLQHWLHSMALRISKLFYLWLTPADPSKIFDPINALHSGLGSFLPIFGGHRAFLRNLTSGWPWLTRVWPLTPAMHYTLVMGSFHQIWWP